MNYKERDNEKKKGKKSYQERILEERDAENQIESYYNEEEEEDDDDRDPWATPTYPNSY